MKKVIKSRTFMFLLTQKHESICSCSAASIFSSPRKPSSADTFVSHQDPQNDGQKSSKPHIFITASRTYQDFLASPKLTIIHLLVLLNVYLTQSLKETSVSPKDTLLHKHCKPRLLIAYYFILRNNY